MASVEVVRGVDDRRSRINHIRNGLGAINRSLHSQPWDTGLQAERDWFLREVYSAEIGDITAKLMRGTEYGRRTPDGRRELPLTLEKRERLEKHLGFLRARQSRLASQDLTNIILP